VSLLRCRIATGRRHQIRVHLAARGWAVLGDMVYGAPLDGFPRLALHAWHLSFDHPRSGERIAVTCPPPAELDALIARCGLAGRQNYTTPASAETSRR
jgi:23S rRNA pseudouridine1911/1915/1917 synthase